MEPSTQVPTTDKLQTREVKQRQTPLNFLSAMNAELINEKMPHTSMTSYKEGERQMTDRATNEGDELIKKMMQRVEQELNEEFEYLTAAPKAAEMAANTTTTTAATTAVSATATGAVGRTSAEAAADANRASKAEPPPLLPPPELATIPSLPPPGTSSGSDKEPGVIFLIIILKKPTTGIQKRRVPYPIHLRFQAAVGMV